MEYLIGLSRALYVLGVAVIIVLACKLLKAPEKEDNKNNSFTYKKLMEAKKELDKENEKVPKLMRVNQQYYDLVILTSEYASDNGKYYFGIPVRIDNRVKTFKMVY